MNYPFTLSERCSKRLLLLLSAGVFCLCTGCVALRSTEPVPPADVPAASDTPAEPTETVSVLPDTPGPSLHPIPLENVFPAVPPKAIPEAEPWIQRYNDRYGEQAAGQLLLHPADIEIFNRSILENCPTVTDIAAVPAVLPGNDIRQKIERYFIPQGDFYDRAGQGISYADRENIWQNRHLEALGESVTVRCGIITSRCDLRSLPTDRGFYRAGDTFYSNIQETELFVGMPVWILHESADKRFLFVQAYHYAGWIDTGAAAVCTAEDFALFAQPARFVTVTVPLLPLDGQAVDMGAVFPYLHEEAETYTISFPERDADGNLRHAEKSIPKTAAVYGFLPYTMENYYRQAFAYLGTPYGWGGADNGVDCSGFVCAVFRTFGFRLPRNTGEQKQYGGVPLLLERLSAQQTAEQLSTIRVPAALHRPGHVMLYLGQNGRQHFVIHAPQGGEQVSVMPLNLPGGLTRAMLLTSSEK